MFGEDRGCFPGTSEIVLDLHRSLTSTGECGFYGRTSVGFRAKTDVRPHTSSTTYVPWAVLHTIQGMMIMLAS